MSFGAGKDCKVYVNGYDLSAYFNKADAQRKQAAYDSTTFGNSAKTFIPGLADGSVSVDGFFDGATAADDAVLSAAIGASSDAVVLAFPQGDARGNRGFGCAAIETSYQATDPVDGVVSVAAAFQADGGVDSVVSLHPLGAETTTVDSTAVDNGAATTNGGAGYIEATAFTGSSVVVKVQHSTDNVTFADLITFTAISAAHAKERKTVTGTVNRYVRASHASGTFSSVTDVVAFARNAA